MDQMQTEKTEKQINWHEYNYPPLIKLMHFRPSQLPEDRKSLVMQLFVIHIIVFLNTILSIVDNCIEVNVDGGLQILYAFLWMFIFNPIVLFIFYRGYIGLCKQKSKLSLYIYIQPLVILVEVAASIIDFIGFNGFIRVSFMFNNGMPLAGVFGLVISIIYLIIALWSGYLYFRIFRQRSLLTKALL